MIPVILFSIMLLIVFVVLRVQWINCLVDDWNHNLSILIERYECNANQNNNTLAYYKKSILKPKEYYHKLHVWSINNIINDPFLLDDVQRIIQTRYFN